MLAGPQVLIEILDGGMLFIQHPLEAVQEHLLLSIPHMRNDLMQRPFGRRRPCGQVVRGQFGSISEEILGARFETLDHSFVLRVHLCSANFLFSSFTMADASRGERPLYSAVSWTE